MGNGFISGDAQISSGIAQYSKIRKNSTLNPPALLHTSAPRCTPIPVLATISGDVRSLPLPFVSLIPLLWALLD